VQAVRHLLAQRQVVLWLCAVTLILRLLVPTGYMIGSDHGHVAIIACPGVTAPVQAAAMPMVHHAAESRPSDHRPSDHGPSDGPCASAGLSAAMLGAVDPVLLAGLVAFILRLGFVATRVTLPAAFRHARPPLRGPPALT
jgi:hypothetical protein